MKETDDGAQGRPEKNEVKSAVKTEIHDPTIRGISGFSETVVPLVRTRSTGARLPLSGGDPKAVLERIQKSRGAATGMATPANSAVDLSGKTTEQILDAFDFLEKSQRALGEFFEAVADFGDRGVNPREAFAEAPGARERFRVLTVSASRLYQAVAASSLARFSAERVLGVSLADLGEAIVVALEVLDYTGARHG